MPAASSFFPIVVHISISLLSTTSIQVDVLSTSPKIQYTIHCVTTRAMCLVVF